MRLDAFPVRRSTTPEVSASFNQKRRQDHDNQKFVSQHFPLIIDGKSLFRPLVRCLKY